MRKSIVIFISCLLICICAYRWGSVGVKDAKSTVMEQMYINITQAFLPSVYFYDMTQMELLYQDAEQIMMPVFSCFRVQHDVGKDIVSENTSLENNSTKEDEKQKEHEPQAQEPIEIEIDTSKETVTTPFLEKKVTINRIKLQDFDYLRQKFYQVDSSTTIGNKLLDADKLLAMDLSLKENVQGPQILIYHTHSQEAYADSKENDVSTSIVAVGDYLASLLEEKYGIQVLHHKGEYDVSSRSSAYSKARPAITKILEENPTIEVVIDLHRDGVPESTHLVTQVEGKSMAQIMFFNGLSRTTTTGELDYLYNPYIEDNLAFSLQMQIAAAEYFPGLTRKIYLKGYRYNMHLCPKSLLVEVGAQTNTFEEACNSMEPLAKLLVKVLKTDKVP